MSRRRSLPMHGRAPRSEVAPFVPGEAWNDRHQRRMEVAVDMVDVARRDLAERDPGLELRVCSPGHWQIRDGKTILAQWCPQSGRFVPGEQYDRARKCHDVHQMLAALGRALAEDQS